LYMSTRSLCSRSLVIATCHDVRVKNGEMAEFNCSFEGQPFTGVVWDHNGQSLADTERVRRSQSGGLFSLVIQSVGVVDQGVYRCTATNQHGQNSSSAQHRIVPMEINIGNSAKFECETEDAPNVSFKWYKDGQSIKEGDKYRIISRFRTSSLELLAPTKEDSGEYTCKASNQHGSDECSASLSVTGKSDACFFPLRWLSLGLLLVAMIQCVITGSAPLNVVWLKDNQDLPKVPAQYQTFCEKNKHNLEITTLEAADRGLYVCKVSNNVGTAECSMELRVIDKPNFVKPLGPVAAVVGAPLHLECQVDEDTGVNVTWTRDGRKVHQSPDCKLSFEDKTVTLDIIKTTLKDCGNFVCTVANEAGSATCSTSVKVQGKSCLLDFHEYCSI
uniref:Ig-like domain-containing protein n=1 Tax=Seriola lalandi dorsalis TaxID=1841481 RepID=A0A3B4X0N7_SERLL